MSDKVAGMAREMGGRAQDTIGDTIGDANMRTRGMYNQAAGRAQQAWGQAQDASDQLGDAIRGQPLVAAAIALGIGYLIGRLTA